MGSADELNRRRLRRRRVLLGGLGIAGALVIGWSVLPPRQRLHAKPPHSLPPQTFALNGWVQVAATGRVTVMLARAKWGRA